MLCYIKINLAWAEWVTNSFVAKAGASKKGAYLKHIGFPRIERESLIDLSYQTRLSASEGMEIDRLNKSNTIGYWEMALWVAKNVPFINFFYDALFDTTPDPESIVALLNLVALINGLLIAIACSLVTSVDFDEMEQADLRWTNATATSTSYYFDLFTSHSNYIIQSEVYTPSVQFSRLSTLGCGFIFMSLLSAVICYMDMLGKDFSNLSFSSWWVFGKWAILMTVSWLIIGTFCFINAYGVLAVIKIPESFCTEHYYQTNADVSCPYGYQFLSFVVISWGTLIVVFLLVGFGTRSHYKFETHDEAADPMIGKANEFVEEAMRAGEQDLQVIELVLQKSRMAMWRNRVTLEQLKDLLRQQPVDYGTLKRLGIELIGHQLLLQKYLLTRYSK